MNIKQIKKELGISDKDIAKFFGYKNKQSYYHASRRKHIEQGILNIYRLSQEKLPDAKKAGRPLTDGEIENY